VPNFARVFILLAALAAYLTSALLAWHDDMLLRKGVGIVAATLVLWIGEVAPLGVVALGIPVMAVFSGVMTWDKAIASWGDKVLFLFLGAFLLARALDKHGAFDWIRGAPLDPAVPGRGPGVLRLSIVVLVLSGAVSLFQNNTAVTAMLLPPVTLLARRTPWAALPLLALSYGATLGGMGTPVGTAPNFIGYAEIRRLDDSYSFMSWTRVGIPIWIGATLLAWALLAITMHLWRARPAGADGSQPATPAAYGTPECGPDRAPLQTALTIDERRNGRRWAFVAFAVTAGVWLTTGAIRSAANPGGDIDRFVKTFLPEELIPIATAWLLFMVRVGPRRRAVLDRHDFQALDWDTLFLIAGGLTLGEVLRTCGAAEALAVSVAGLAWSPTMVLLALAGATVLLSELTSNTATASLLVPIAASVAPAAGVSAPHAIMLVALCASLGFALPISTPPNALVYGTRLIPLRTMAIVGLALDLVCIAWVIACVRWFA
jgi:sodium-dependent dicarboxylate transporter 2/3/5